MVGSSSPTRPHRLSAMDWRRISWPGRRLSASSVPAGTRLARTPIQKASRSSTRPSTGPGAVAPTRSPTTRCGGSGRVICRRATSPPTMAMSVHLNGRWSRLRVRSACCIAPVATRHLTTLYGSYATSPMCCQCASRPGGSRSQAPTTRRPSRLRLAPTTTCATTSRLRRFRGLEPRRSTTSRDQRATASVSCWASWSALRRRSPSMTSSSRAWRRQRPLAARAPLQGAVQQGRHTQRAAALRGRDRRL